LSLRPFRKKGGERTMSPVRKGEKGKKESSASNLRFQSLAEEEKRSARIVFRGRRKSRDVP